MAAPTPQLGKTGKYGDLKRRLFFLLAALVVFRVGAHIPVPGIHPEVLAEPKSAKKDAKEPSGEVKEAKPKREGAKPAPEGKKGGKS